MNDEQCVQTLERKYNGQNDKLQKTFIFNMKNTTRLQTEILRDFDLIKLLREQWCGMWTELSKLQITLQTYKLSLLFNIGSNNNLNNSAVGWSVQKEFENN